MKFVRILIAFILVLFFNTTTFADTKQDCSQYNTKTIIGAWDKARCEKGKPPREKLKLGEKLKKLNPFKKKN